MSMDTSRFNALITGIGGQGNVLASRLIAQGFMSAGKAVRTAETIGMSQRGGTVLSHVRAASSLDDIASSLIGPGQADLVIAFEPGEALRAVGYLSPDGLMLTATAAQRPVTATLAREPYDGRAQLAWLTQESGRRVIALDGSALVEAAGNPKVLNVIMLGAAIGNGALPLTRDEMADAIRLRVKPRFVDVNIHALDLGIANCTGGACRRPE